uniref:Uncharacterized protein n=1 Tax=Anguilla anguilla TaxID=7936 RepID=A0A0E9WI82_ANGAN
MSCTPPNCQHPNQCRCTITIFVTLSSSVKFSMVLLFLRCGF